MSKFKTRVLDALRHKFMLVLHKIQKILFTANLWLADSSCRGKYWREQQERSTTLTVSFELWASFVDSFEGSIMLLGQYIGNLVVITSLLRTWDDIVTLFFFCVCVDNSDILAAVLYLLANQNRPHLGEVEEEGNWWIALESGWGVWIWIAYWLGGHS